ncbi:MAG: hypothetical protein A2Y38_10700 [Spirochaetes bacterium GWB1_59_5]|nr:MAG: hypothetical protein A2Y38_10700 [Spirochaetes bacterium GWB1_59_5]
MTFPGDPDFKYIDEDERRLIEDIEEHSDEWQPMQGKALADMRTKLAVAAKNTMARLENKTERMNIRMTQRDMANLKITAAREGLPYQSLVTSILHKFTEGRLVDIEEARKVLRE